MIPTASSFVALMFACALLMTTVSCSTGPSIGANSSRAYTPPKYQELRLLVLRPSKSDSNRWNLNFAYESVDAELIIKPGDPLAVVVGDVYLPRDFSGRRDIVVLVDILSSRSQGLQSYAVWYQRGVMAGQRLGFDSLLVHSDRAWSPLTPPRFTVRVIDVSKERNAETRAAFSGLNSAVAGISAFVPHPAAPAAAAAIRIAGLVASNRENVPIIDFTPQFYGADFVAASGPSDIPLFMRGTWLAIGRAPGAGPEFWTNEFRLSRRTGEIYNAEGKALPVPYMRLTMSTAEVVLPQLVLDRSKALFDILSESQTDRGTVDAVGKQLTSSILTYNFQRELVSHRTKEAVANIMQKLEAGGSFGSADEEFMVTLLARTLGQKFGSVTAATSWWAQNIDKGDFDQVTGKWTPIDSKTK